MAKVYAGRIKSVRKDVDNDTQRLFAPGQWMRKDHNDYSGWGLWPVTELRYATFFDNPELDGLLERSKGLVYEVEVVEFSESAQLNGTAASS